MSSANKHNKVKFNISNVHYAPLSQDNDGKYTWGVPVALPGAVSLSLDPQGEPESFYADGIEYYVINNNQGYDGDLEVAMIPESFRRDILMETADANSVLLENAASETGKFACLDYNVQKNELCISGMDSTGIPRVWKLALPDLYSYASDGAWLPRLESDGVPAYIKARTT